MIIQREGQETPGRVRRWQAKMHHGRGGAVVLIHYVDDLTPDEDLSDFPDVHELSWDEWAVQCGDYGLDIDGQPG